MEVEQEEEPFGLGCALELFTEAGEVASMIDNLKTIHSDPQSLEKAAERFNTIISQYNEQPHLLDKHLESLLEQCIATIRDPNAPMAQKHAIFGYICTFINVRGYKVVVRLLPHEVADFEAVLQLLEAQDANDSPTWTTRYVLLLWMSIIIMIPFDLSRFDGFAPQSVMERVLKIIQIYTIVPDKCMDAAAYLSARFIARNDVKEALLGTYLEWAMEVSLRGEGGVFVKQGSLLSVAMILKLAKREDLLPFTGRLLQWIVNDDIKKDAGCVVQKLVYKIIQRIGLVLLPPRIATWRYNRGNRSLAANLCGGDGTPSSTTSSSVVSVHDLAPPSPIEVPDEIEEVIDQLIQGLRSADSIVRWSAAKGVGRVTSRLPQQLADEVVASILDLFSPREGDGAWHGGCLALAELGRRGLLLPGRLSEVVAVVLKALVYDEPRGYASVGAHIRDAACYVAWSFARAYDTEILKPFVNEIAAQLLIVTCFDREINCRRAASAAFQENVGRQGTFPHGIDILTVADFYAISVRNNAYLGICAYIAQFDEYTIPMIKHLVERKVDHWDCGIRELVAKSLHNLAPLAPRYMLDTVLPQLFENTMSIDLNTRHGSVLCIGEILSSLSKHFNEIERANNITTHKNIKEHLGDDLFNEITLIVPGFRQKHYFRGMGGELMRHACCSLIQNCGTAALELYDDVTLDWLDLINECIAYNVPNVQNSAINALPTLLSVYFNNSTITSKLDFLVGNYLRELQSTVQQETRMGHALALGALPKFMLDRHLEKVVTALIQCTKITPPTAKWAESRRDAIKALTTIVATMANEIGSGDFGEDDVLEVYTVFLTGLQDYTQDKRGDVGAWVREASIVALQTLTFRVCDEKHELLNGKPSLVRCILSGVGQQAVEKIDRTRALAARVFHSFLYNIPEVPNVPHLAELRAIFPESDSATVNWNSAADTFPKFVQLLRFKPFTYNIMLGMVCSVGGLTETLVKNSSAAFFEFINKIDDEAEKKRLCDVIYEIFKYHPKNDRITIAMFRFLEKLFSSGTISNILDDRQSEFARKVLKLVLAETSGCKDVHKLIDGINLLAQFLQIKNEISRHALAQLCILLCHRQIYVRKSTSTTLYDALLLYGDNFDQLDEIMEVLSVTNWEEPIEVVKPIRNQLCDLFLIPIPVTAKKTQK